MSNNKRKKENPFRILARWFTRWFLGGKYEKKLFLDKDKEENQGTPDDSELIVSPGRQVYERFVSRKFAVFSVIVVVSMFIFVFVGPLFMPKYYDAYTEVTLKNLPPNKHLMSVPSELKNDIKMIDGYGGFTVGLSNAGKVYIWGATGIGATGVDVGEIPEEVKKAKIAYIAAGIDHVIAIGEDGTFYGWGSNRFGQYSATQAVLENSNLQPVPEEIEHGKIDVNNIKKLVCGYQATALLMNDGTLYIWGNKQAYSNLDKFVDRGNFADIDFTLNYVVGIDENGSNIITGVRKLYDTVRGHFADEGVKMSEYLNGRKIVAITAANNNICLTLDDGTVAVTGDMQADFIEIPELQGGEKVVSVAAGSYHYTCITDQGNVYSFGGDHYYQAETPKSVTTADKIYTGAFQNYAIDSDGSLIGRWGLKGFLFGTDESGASIAERVVAGGRVTMTFGAIAVIIEIIIGVSLGLLAGYRGGWVDLLVMRIAEVFGSLPLYPFMLIANSLLTQVALSTNQKLLMFMVVLGILGWPGFCSLTRAQILVARESEYVTAAQAMGVKGRRIAFKHILPNVISVILVNMTLSFASSMQTETSLSFLGFGVVYPQPSWGNMLSRASNATTALNFWWQWIFTSAILVLTTICINTIGDTLRDVMDPKSSNDK